MGYIMHCKGRVVDKSEECTYCNGPGAVRGQTRGEEVALCPRCHGTGVEPRAQVYHRLSEEPLGGIPCRKNEGAAP